MSAECAVITDYSTAQVDDICDCQDQRFAEYYKQMIHAGSLLFKLFVMSK